MKEWERGFIICCYLVIFVFSHCYLARLFSEVLTLWKSFIVLPNHLEFCFIRIFFEVLAPQSQNKQEVTVL